MATPDSEVRIDIRARTDKLSGDLSKGSKELDRLTKTFDRQVASIRKQENALADMQRKLDAIIASDKQVASLTAMESQLKRINKEVQAQEVAYADVIARIEQANLQLQFARGTGREDEAAKAEDALGKLDEESLVIATALENARDRAAELSSKINEVKLDPSTSIEAQNLQEKIALATDNLENARAAANTTNQQIIELLGNKDESTERNIDKTARATKRLGRETKNAGRQARTASNGFERLGKKLKALVLTAFVFSIIRKGLQYLRDELGGLLLANEKFAQSWNNIRVNLLTAFAPFWEVIQPKIIYFMGILERVTAVLANFVALLFGKTYQQAKDAAEAIHNQAEAIKEAEEAAKKASKSLASFDKINQLVTNTAEDQAKLDFGAPQDMSWVSDSIPWLDSFKRMLSSIADLAKEIWSTFKDVWHSDIGLAYLEAVNEFLKMIFNTVADIADVFLIAWRNGNVGRKLVESLFEMFTNILWLLTSIGNAFREAWNDGIGVSIATNLYQIFTNIFRIIGQFALKLREAWEENDNGVRIWQAILGFVNDILSTINRMTAATVDWVKNLNLGPLMNGIANLSEAFRNLAGIVINALGDAYEDILLPFIGWLAEIFVPAALELLADAFNLIGAVFEAIQPGISWIWENFLQPFAEWTGGTIIDVLGYIGEKFRWLTDLIDENGELITLILEQVGIAFSFVLDLIELVVTTAVGFLKGGVDAILQTLGGLIIFLTGVFTGDWEKAWEGVKEIFAGVFNGIVNLLESAVNLIIDGINFMTKQLNKISFEVPDWVPEIGGETFGFNIPEISKISIPRLATGGVVDQATVAMIGERGREAVLPLDRGDWKRELAQELAGEIALLMPTQTGTPSINLIAEGDSGQIFRLFKFRLEQEDSRVGGGFSRVVTVRP